MTTRPQPSDGEPFGRYRLLECLGEGRMAVVYRALTEGPKGFSREVVLKVMDELQRANVRRVGLLVKPAN